MKYDPIKELNDEQEASLLKPFKVIIWSMVLGPAGIALVLSQKVALDAFALRHPVIVGLSLIALAVTGMVVMVRKMMW